MKYALAVAAMVLAACAMRSAAPRASSAAPGIDGMQGRGDAHAEIQRLADAIAQARADDGLAASPLPAIAPGPLPMASVPVSTDPACTHGTSDTCTSACTLADSICDNAAKICALAEQLAGDRWAADKCTDGKASCEQAHAKCCACS